MTVEERVTLLESRMTALEALPERFESLEGRIDRLEVALRAEIRAGDEDTRRVLREEFRHGNNMIVTALTEQIEESRRHTRVLFEEMQSRLATSGEGVRPRKKRR